MKYVWLTKGLFTIFDDDDFRLVSRFRWYAHKTKQGFYAACRPVWNEGLVLMHRLVMQAKPGEYVDHRDGEKLDNRKENLRRVTQSQNMHNSNPRVGSSGFKGVSWAKHTNKWEAYITVNYKRHHLGLFESALEAAIVYDAAAIRLVGDCARTNAQMGLVKI